ncbi:hypothetical protein SLS55_002879 [Diplodia seriata]|uniref:Rhodopsin domain-containing protein n=1 Tax=Diplodia seriata TaxID=420778 RepID=A0ABR3CLE3_9PEZI
MSYDAHVYQSVYTTQVCYGPTVFATKASILFFLTRVFAPFERYCRFVNLFTMLMGLYYTLMVFLKIFICRPIHLFWTPSSEGQCFDQRSLILADNIISLVTDIAVLIIPCPLAGGLKVATSAKLRIAAAFGAGGLACVCSFIRLIDIIKIGGSPDATYSFTLINLFGIAEVGIGLVCACFPVMPAFWKYLRKRHPTQMTGGSYPTSGHGRSQPGGRSAHRSAASGGIELTGKKSHLSSTGTRSYVTNEPRTPRHGSMTLGGKQNPFDNGSDENMLISHAEGMVTVSVRGGEDLELGRTESAGDHQQGGGGEGGGGGGGVSADYGTKRSYEDQGIVRTVEVQMMREPK